MMTSPSLSEDTGLGGGLAGKAFGVAALQCVIRCREDGEIEMRGLFHDAFGLLSQLLVKDAGAFGLGDFYSSPIFSSGMVKTQPELLGLSIRLARGGGEGENVSKVPQKRRQQSLNDSDFYDIREGSLVCSLSNIVIGLHSSPCGWRAAAAGRKKSPYVLFAFVLRLPPVRVPHLKGELAFTAPAKACAALRKEILRLDEADDVAGWRRLI